MNVIRFGYLAMDVTHLLAKGMVNHNTNK